MVRSRSAADHAPAPHRPAAGALAAATASLTAESNRPKIVVKKARPHRPPHHAGAWKVAYADFVTAMMAFFLLLWLLNVTTDDQKKGLAEFFSPESVSKGRSGSGAVLGGNVASQGGLLGTDAGIVLGVPVERTGGEADEEFPDKTAPPKSDAAAPPSDDPGAADIRAASEQDLRRELLAREERNFARVERELRSAIEDVPELRPLQGNLLIDRTPEGLRIQIVDQQKQEMFALGAAVANEHMQRLMGLVARAVARLPNPLAITGYTDSLPYPPGAQYTNWELSLDRANASRRALLAGGLAPARILLVTGKADTEPLFPENAADPRNRRISIVLRRDATLAGGAPAVSPSAVPSGVPALPSPAQTRRATRN
jgi:chemotaxis protein MotB